MITVIIGQNSLGETINYLRRINGLSQKQLANLLSVSVMTISNYEQNKVCPSLHIVSRLSVVFGVGMEVFLKGMEPERKCILDK